MNILIIEDEPSYQEIILRYLGSFLPQPHQIEVCNTLAAGEQAIHAQLPDLLLLDINLPDGLSFELLERIGPKRLQLKIIFISAHDDYAIKAFKFSAIDYVLKPIDATDFQLALSKVLSQDSSAQTAAMSALQENISDKQDTFKKIVLKDANAIYLIEVQNIMRCESESNYTTFFLEDGRSIIVSTTLKEYDKMLASHTFFRTHQSHLINLNYFDRYDKRDGGCIIMKNGDLVPLSKRKKDRLMEKLSQLG